MRESFYEILITDVEDLLRFTSSSKTTQNELINNFIKKLAKIYGKGIIQIESKLKYKKFMIEDGGFFSIVLDKPIIFQAYFIKKEKGEAFLKALKKVLRTHVENNDIKDILIDNLELKRKEDFNDSIDILKTIHKLAIKRSFVFSIVILILFAFFEIIKQVLLTMVASYESFRNFYTLTNILGAVLIAFLFEPIKNKTDQLLSKVFKLN